MGRKRKHPRPAAQPLHIGQVAAEQTRQLRTNRGWSQARLAEELRDRAGTPLSTSTVQKLEEGGRRVSIEEVLALAFVLDTAPVEMLVGGRMDDVGRIPLFGAVNVTREEAREWIVGDSPLSAQDERRFEAQIGVDRYLANKRVEGLAEVQHLTVELARAANRGDDDHIDRALEALEAQVRHVRRAFGRVRGFARVGAIGMGRAEHVQGSREALGHDPDRRRGQNQ